MEVLTNSVNEWNVAVANKAREYKDWHFASVDSVGSFLVINLNYTFFKARVTILHLRL
jgi:hypothetical protein